MIAHLIGGKPCPNASKTAKKVAKQVKGDKKAGSDGDDESSDAEGSERKKRRKLENGKALTQKTLSLPKGIAIPFSREETSAIKCQFLRATISANLPYRWVSDPEVKKLFLMLRSRADEVLPGRREMSGRILDNEYVKVEEDLHKLLKGQFVLLS